MDEMDTRQEIVEAAYRVLVTKGFSGTTIDAVAAEAGITKGGVIYYFPNKHALLAATVLRFQEGMEAKRAQILATLPSRSGNRIRASIQAHLDNMDRDMSKTKSGIAILGDPALRKVVCDMKRRNYKDLVEEANDPEKLAMLLYLLDGMWINLLFDPPAIPVQLRERVERMMVEMADSLGV